jgi:hypothetical protein
MSYKNSYICHIDRATPTCYTGRVTSEKSPIRYNKCEGRARKTRYPRPVQVGGSPETSQYKSVKCFLYLKMEHCGDAERICKQLNSNPPGNANTEMKTGNQSTPAQPPPSRKDGTRSPGNYFVRYRKHLNK